MTSLVSIIMANYNGSKFLSEAIESVLLQTYTEWELLVVDDASTDNSLSIIKRYEKNDKRIFLYELTRNSGPANARNYAIQKAKGRYISFLDSDDVWLPVKLQKEIAYMQKYSISLVYSSYYTINEYSELNGIFIIPKKQIHYKELLKSCIIGNLTAMYDSFYLNKKYMIDVGHEDYALWLDILKNIDFAYGIQEPLAAYRIRKNSVSSNKVKAAKYQWKIYREIEKLSFLKSLYYFAFYAYNGVTKYKNK